jgi:hypothetical protein
MVAVGLQAQAGQAAPAHVAPQTAISSLLPQQAYGRLPVEPFAIDPALAAYAAYMQSLPYSIGRVW